MIKKAIGISIFALSLAGISPLSSYAAGWSQTSSGWVYLDDNQNRITNAWRRGADNRWRYLDSQGNMAMNAWVDDNQYYVDGQGLIVTGWKQFTTGRTTYWAYFQDNGKIVQSDWKKVGDKSYYFNDEGHMLTGWVLDNGYYLNSDGSMAVGWKKLTPPSEDADGGGGPESSSGDGQRWYYFLSNGKKYVPEGGAEFGERKIGNSRFAFNDKGEMVTGWVRITSGGANGGSIKNYKYYNSDGTIRTGWYSIDPPEALADRYDNTVEWFYFSSSGEPHASASSKLLAGDLVRIKGNQYLFNENGVPVYGLVKVYTDNDRYTAFYFGTKRQCYALKGRQTVTEEDGTSYSYYFLESGKGLTGVRDSKLYYMGKEVRASKDVSYQVFSVPNDTGDGYTNYVVNASGHIVKNTKVKNRDRVEYKTNSSGVLQSVDGNTETAKEKFETPLEPDWFE